MTFLCLQLYSLVKRKQEVPPQQRLLRAADLFCIRAIWPIVPLRRYFKPISEHAFGLRAACFPFFISNVGVYDQDFHDLGLSLQQSCRTHVLRQAGISSAKKSGASARHHTLGYNEDQQSVSGCPCGQAPSVSNM